MTKEEIKKEMIELQQAIDTAVEHCSVINKLMLEEEKQVEQGNLNTGSWVGATDE